MSVELAWSRRTERAVEAITGMAFLDAAEHVASSCSEPAASDIRNAFRNLERRPTGNSYRASIVATRDAANPIVALFDPARVPEGANCRDVAKLIEDYAKMQRQLQRAGYG